jgi:hypothetical protein
MIRFYKRSLTEDEKEVVEKDVNLKLKVIKKGTGALKRILWLFFFCSLLGAGYLFFSDFNINSFFGWLSGTIIIFFIIGIWAYIEAILRNKREVQTLLEYPNEVEVVHCKSNKAILFKEWEDLGIYFLFQVEPNKMFFVGGQEYRELNKLPNTNFEIIRAKRPASFYYFWKVLAKGRKFNPVRTVSSDDVNKLYKKRKHPSLLWDNESIIKGKIEDFDLS